MYKLIDGKSISTEIINELKTRVDCLKVSGKNIVLADILVGDDPASLVYANSKSKKFNELGIEFNLIRLDSSISESELINKIIDLNNDQSISGIFVEMPLPSHICANKVVDMILPNKDLDGFSKMSLGALFSGENGFYPCTAEGIVELLKRSNIEISGKHCVVVGRSNVVGKPVAILLLKENATVTICHSKTKNLEEICKMADILIVAIGKAKFIDDKYVKEGAIVVDAGINRIEKDGKSIICGDVDFDKVANHTSFITPVPGGVGPMTTTMLIRHCVKCLNYE